MESKVYNINGERYTLSPLVPIVEKRLWSTVQGLLKDLPAETEKIIKSKDIKKLSMFELIDLLGGFAIENQCKLLACVLTPEGFTEENKNLSIIENTLVNHLRFKTKFEVISDFFTSEDTLFFLSQILTIQETIKNIVNVKQ
jgi:hypothetical protein